MFEPITAVDPTIWSGITEKPTPSHTPSVLLPPVYISLMKTPPRLWMGSVA